MSCTGTNSCGCGCNNGRIPTGPKGYNGWSPTFQTVVDEVNLDENGDYRVVLQLVSWIGGQGPIPTSFVNQYVSTTGYTSTLANATNIRGERGENATIETGDEVPDSCDLEGEIFIDVTTGIIYRCNGSTYESTSTTIINATTVLNLDISADVDKECMYAEITGDTLGDYLQGIITYVCENIGADPSIPVYNNTQIFAGGVNTGFIGSSVENDNIPIKTAAEVLAFFGGTGLAITEGVNKFTVPALVTRVQFELYGGGGAENEVGNRQFQYAFIIKDDGTNYFFSQGGGDINDGMGGESSCPISENGMNGSVGIGGSGNLGLNGTIPSTPTDIGGGEGAYGKVTLLVSPGDVYYIWSFEDTNGGGDAVNNISKVIIKY